MNVYTAVATCELPEIVAKLSKGNPLENRIIFCEDKFTLALELAVAKQCGGTFCTHVFSFNRYMHKHLPSNKKTLSPEACALVIKGLLLENKNALSCFKNVYDPNLASVVYELIAQLKSAKVTPNDILRAQEASSGILQRKLKDIYLLFSAYENYITARDLTDGNNRLNRLPEHFNNDEKIKDTHVIIAGFPSLNKTLCEIFKSLCKNAKRIDFVLVAGENAGVYTNETYNFITQEYPLAEVFRVKNGHLRRDLLNDLYNSNALLNPEKKDGEIYYFETKDLLSEITQVAKIIKKGVMAGANYKDYALCAEDLSSYELTIRRVFADYDIPLFYDGTGDLGKHPLTLLVCSYIDLARRNFDVKDFFRFVKNPLFIADKKISDEFENYCLSCSITRKTIKTPFTLESDKLEVFEEIRKCAVEVCSYVSEKQTFSKVIEGVYKMLEKLGAFKKVKDLSASLTAINQRDISAYNDQVEDKFNAVISDAVSLLGESKFPLAEVKNIILSGMTACKVSLIPEYNDCVFVGDFRATKYNQAKNLFAVGLCDGVPVSKIDTALLCDRDIAKMEESKVLVEPKIKEVNRRAREVACMALSAFTDRLYLSYPHAQISGDENKESEIIKYVREIFNLKEIFEDPTDDYLSARPALYSFANDVWNYYDNKVNNFDNASAYYKAIESGENEKTFADGILNEVNGEVGYYKDSYFNENLNYANGKLSATAIEGYFSCPYSNFIKNGLKLKEREELNLKANDLGTMVHEVGEIFINEVDWNASEEAAMLLAKKIFAEVSSHPQYARYQQSESGKTAFNFIGEEAVRFCQNLYYTSMQSKLKPKYLEVSFGRGKNPPIKIQTQKGDMFVTGKIDRIDADEAGENMVVIDYKTGYVDKKDTDINLYTGQKLQLFLYAKAFDKNSKLIGAYYFPVSDDFKEEVEPFYVGKTISDKQKASLIDKELDGDALKSAITGANFTLKKDGEIRYPGGLLGETEFEKYADYAVKVAGKGLEEATGGVIIPSPYDGACDYCKFHGLCGFDSLNGLTREIQAVNKEDIVRAVTNETGDKENKEGGEE